MCISSLLQKLHCTAPSLFQRFHTNALEVHICIYDVNNQESLISISSSPLTQFPNLKRESVLQLCQPRMKMMKAVKKLKFWSRKKRKKKTQEPYYPPPPPPCHCYHSCYSTQPSAPPLPPWLEPEQTHLVPDISYPSQTQLPPQPREIIDVLETSPMYPTLPAPTASISSSSYQQYMVPNPVYGMPVVETARRERRAGFFGCVVNFGVHLIRCFCPCFSIRELH